MKLVNEGSPDAQPISVTHLVHPGPAPMVRPKPPGLRFQISDKEQAAISERMYARVGEPWLWVDRAQWSVHQWQEWVRTPGFVQWLVFVDDDLVGYAEFVTEEPGTVRIAFFGLLPSHVGRGLGGWWLEQVLALAWQQPTVSQVTLHTCELDHPAALPNYLSRGFIPVRTDVEWRSSRE